MKKRWLAALLCLGLLLTPAGAAGEASGDKSGSLDMAKLSKEEIARMLEGSPLGYAGEAMEVAPSLRAPYAAGTPNEAARAAALARFNALRCLAGLPGVQQDADLNRRAQTGAALLAATGTLTHHPTQPSDMDDLFYQLGHNAVSSSNIYQGAGATLPQAVEAFFDDSDAANLPSLGHRRWMLNPAMGKTGLGFSPSGYTNGSANYNFATLWAFDESGPAVDYNFIAWPASGNFPDTLFHSGQAWSVTLNPQSYAAPDLARLTVILTRTSDGKTWTLSGTGAATPANQGAYLGVNTDHYGVSNAIIFRPDLGGESYRGVYTVSIQGLQSPPGADMALSYQVDFFDPARPGSVTQTQPSQSATPLTAFTDVVPGSWYEEAVAYAANRSLFNGVGGGCFDPEGPMTRSMVMTVLARLDGEDTTPRPLETWDIRGRRWAVTNRVSDGLNSGEAITLEELATMLYRYAQLRYDAHSAHNYHLPTMPDGNSVSSWATDGANWAVDAGILIGDEDQKLNPQRSATRAQVAIILQRFLTENGL